MNFRQNNREGTSFHPTAAPRGCGNTSKALLVGIRRGGSNEYPQSMLLSGNKKKYQIFLSENFYFLAVRFLVYLNRHVFVTINYARILYLIL